MIRCYSHRRSWETKLCVRSDGIDLRVKVNNRGCLGRCGSSGLPCGYLEKPEGARWSHGTHTNHLDSMGYLRDGMRHPRKEFTPPVLSLSLSLSFFFSTRSLILFLDILSSFLSRRVSLCSYFNFMLYCPSVRWARLPLSSFLGASFARKFRQKLGNEV